MKYSSRSISESYVSVSLAFYWENRVSDLISAVVVDGEFGADPLEAPVLISVKVLELLLVPPPLALGGAKIGLDRGLAAVDVEALVGGDKGSLGPVCLLKPTPCGPVVRVP